MKQIIGTITERGQVTVPAEIRRVLGTERGGKIVFQVEGNEIRLMRPAFTLESAFCSVEPLNRPEDFEEISTRAKEEHVQESKDKSRRVFSTGLL